MEGAMLEHNIRIHQHENNFPNHQEILKSRPGNDALANALILWQGIDGLDIILSHGVRCGFLIIPHNMVGNDHLQIITLLQNWKTDKIQYRGKDGEPILGVQTWVIAVAVDSR